MIKRLTFVRRAEDVEDGDFGSRWRRQSERMVHSMPSAARPRRMAQCVVRPGKVEPPWDGVGISWFDSDSEVQAYDLWTTHHACEESVVDPDTTVVVPVEARTVRGQEWLERSWTQPLEGPRLALIALIQPAPGLDWTQFRDYWWDQHRPLANSIVPAKVDTVAYVHNYAAPSDAFPWAGIGEMYDESIDTARRRAAWMSTNAAAVLIEDEKRFMNQAGRRVMVVDYEIIVSGPYD